MAERRTTSEPSAKTRQANRIEASDASGDQLAATHGLFWLNKRAPNQKLYKTLSGGSSSFFESKSRTNLHKSNQYRLDMSDDVQMVNSLNTWNATKFQARESVAERIAKKQKSKSNQTAFAIHKQRMDNYFTMSSKILESKADKERKIDVLGSVQQMSKNKSSDKVDLNDQEIVLKNIVKKKIIFSSASLEDTFENQEEMERLLKDSTTASNGVISGFKEMRRKFMVTGPNNPQNKKIFNAIIRDISSETTPTSILKKNDGMMQNSKFETNWVEIFYKFQKKLAKIDKKFHDHDPEKVAEPEIVNAPIRCELDLKIEGVI